MHLVRSSVKYPCVSMYTKPVNSVFHTLWLAILKLRVSWLVYNKPVKLYPLLCTLIGYSSSGHIQDIYWFIKHNGCICNKSPFQLSFHQIKFFFFCHWLFTGSVYNSKTITVQLSVQLKPPIVFSAHKQFYSHLSIRNINIPPSPC